MTAANLAHRVRNGLGTWIRHLAESRGVEVPNFRQMGAWEQ